MVAVRTVHAKCFHSPSCPCRANVLGALVPLPCPAAIEVLVCAWVCFARCGLYSGPTEVWGAVLGLRVGVWALGVWAWWWDLVVLPFVRRSGAEPPWQWLTGPNRTIFF